MSTKRLQGWAAALFIVCASANAFGAEGDEKVQLGLRTGYGIFAGKPFQPANIVFAGMSFSGGAIGNDDVISGQVPIWLDAGYQLTPNLMLGAYGQYGFVTLDSDCSGCSAHDIRFGIQGQYRFLPAGSIDPWLGLGVGYESLSLSESVPQSLNQAGGSGFPSKIDSTLSGWEIANLQTGIDFRVARALTLGPFVSISFDEFTRMNIDYHTSTLPSGSGSISDKALHEWVTLGVKGTFGI